MIAIDVRVPYLGQTYDFSLDEAAPIASLLDEIVNMVCRKEHLPIPSSTNGLSLFSLKQARALPPISTLSHEGIDAGQSLILC